MLSGSCLCGGVAYAVDASAGPIVHCHCATCRKAHGSAFSSVSPVPRDRFRWVRGETLLRAFESSPGKHRWFCTRCGAQMIAERAGQPTILLRLGCLDTPIQDRPVRHIWRGDSASWYDPKDALPEVAEGR
ncbi:MAG: GFA family protein [Alphaproteobacteria bacterium]